MNIGSLINLAAERHPNRPAVIYGDQVLSYRELSQRTQSLAAALRSLGIQPDDRVAVTMWNRPELMESFYAIWQAGGSVVPLNARFLPDEVVYHVADSRCRIIIAGPEFRDTLVAVREQLTTVEAIICVGEPAVGQLDYEELVARHAGAPAEVEERAETDLAWLFYTSGTTGRPKGAMITHGNLNFVTVGWCADLSHLEPEDIGLHAAPLSHGAGFLALALTAKAAAHVIPTSPRFDARSFCELAERHRVTTTWLVPTQIKMLLNLPELERFDLSSLRYVIYGGSPMYVEDLKEALRRLGPVLVQLYGQGETPMTGTYLRREEHRVESATDVQRLASCGHVRTGIELRILDDEDREVPRGTMGEICVRGPSVFRGYWERPAETAETLRNGWLHTGDLGYMDESGYVFIMDRKKDMIISGGSNIYPREVEEVLLEHPSLSEACVFGVPDALWGEAVKAVVVVRAGTSLSEQELIEYCGQRMANYKKPKSIDFVAELPKNSYGKILKRELRAVYWQGQDRMVR